MVVGLGDESRGDGGVGLHLLACLSQLDWPTGVCFRQADESVPGLAQRFSHIILLDALEGPASPGALYKPDPEELLARGVGGEGSGLGLLTMLPAGVRRRVSVFGVQPRTTRWGSMMSADIIASIPLLLPFLRAYILAAAARAAEIN